MSGRLAVRTAIVTGASRGLGKAIALAFAFGGCSGRRGPRGIVTVRVALADANEITGQLLWDHDVLHHELGTRGWLR